MMSGPDKLNQTLSPVGAFLYCNCAYGARLFYGTITFTVGLSAYQIGRRQIDIVRTIHSIVQSGDLVEEDVQKQSDKLISGSIIFLCVYFTIYVVVVSVPQDGRFIQPLITVNYLINLGFILSALLLYSYTIKMVRKSISQCSSFKFDTRATYFIGGMYALLALF